MAPANGTNPRSPCQAECSLMMRLTLFLVVAATCTGCAEAGERRVTSSRRVFFVPWWVLVVVVAVAVAVILLARRRRE